jgi:hypothetical protein
MSSATIHRTLAALATTPASSRGPAPATAEAMLRAQIRHYERHVLAWYALGRVQEARAAWNAVYHLRGCLANARAVADRGASASQVCWREPNPYQYRR